MLVHVIGDSLVISYTDNVHVAFEKRQKRLSHWIKDLRSDCCSHCRLQLPVPLRHREREED